jgi:6,7-dimethyl-8-ribityllumazine synthase
VQSATSAVQGAGDLLGGTASEIPTPASDANRPFDAIIAVGVLIKGETQHFEYISDAVSHGLMRVSLDTSIPVIFGVLTVLNEAQAHARSGIGQGSHNHGEDWGRAAVEMGVKKGEWLRGDMI